MSAIIPAPINIKRHEGDYAEIVIILPDIININDVADVRLQANGSFGIKVIEQNESNTDITYNAEKNSIAIPLKKNDGTLTTKGIHGDLDYEVQVAFKGEIQTILRGKLYVRKEIIK